MSAFDSDVDVLVELGFGSGPLDASPTWTDVSEYVKAGNWTRGRPATQTSFPAGSGGLLLDNTDGRFYSFDTGSPYSPNVKVGVPVRIQAIHDANTYPQFRGFVGDWDSRFPTNRPELINLPIFETYARLIREHVRLTLDQQSSDARVDGILDEAGWPAGARNLDSGVVDLAALDDEESTVGFRLVETAIAEQGHLFQAANGDIRFKNRIANSGVTPAAVFGPDAPDLIYTDVSYEDDEDFLYNEAVVSNVDEDQVTVINATSADAHGTISHPPIDSIDIKNLSEARAVAQWIIERHKEITRRITGLAIDPAGDPANLWPEVLARELRDVITVKIAFPGASITLEQDVTVEQIHHSFVAGDVWTVRYNLHPLTDFESQVFFQLDVHALDGANPLA